jgi:hypothetical protein
MSVDRENGIVLKKTGPFIRSGEVPIFGMSCRGAKRSLI